LPGERTREPALPAHAGGRLPATELVPAPTVHHPPTDPPHDHHWPHDRRPPPLTTC